MVPQSGPLHPRPPIFTTPSSPFLTPNIDRLARSSVRLENYYVHPTCSPTRAALLTGRLGSNVGISVAFVPGRPAPLSPLTIIASLHTGNPGGLSPRYPTLADQLGRMGYRNYLVGKGGGQSGNYNSRL